MPECRHRFGVASSSSYILLLELHSVLKQGPRSSFYCEKTSFAIIIRLKIERLQEDRTPGALMDRFCQLADRSCQLKGCGNDRQVEQGEFSPVSSRIMRDPRWSLHCSLLKEY